jgi:hypothetical protein
MIPDHAYPNLDGLVVMTGVGDVFMDARLGYDVVNHTNLIRLMKANGVNYNLFVDAAANFTEGFIVRFEEDCTHPIYLYNVADGIMAIVMPTRI